MMTAWLSAGRAELLNNCAASVRLTAIVQDSPPLVPE